MKKEIKSMELKGVFYNFYHENAQFFVICYFFPFLKMRGRGIEPRSIGWKPIILPLNYPRPYKFK